MSRLSTTRLPEHHSFDSFAESDPTFDAARRASMSPFYPIASTSPSLSTPFTPSSTMDRRLSSLSHDGDYRPQRPTLQPQPHFVAPIPSRKDSSSAAFDSLMGYAFPGPSNDDHSSNCNRLSQSSELTTPTTATSSYWPSNPNSLLPSDSNRRESSSGPFTLPSTTDPSSFGDSMPPTSTSQHFGWHALQMKWDVIDEKIEAEMRAVQEDAEARRKASVQPLVDGSEWKISYSSGINGDGGINSTRRESEPSRLGTKPLRRANENKGTKWKRSTSRQQQRPSTSPSLCPSSTSGQDGWFWGYESDNYQGSYSRESQGHTRRGSLPASFLRGKVAEKQETDRAKVEGWLHHSAGAVGLGLGINQTDEDQSTQHHHAWIHQVDTVLSEEAQQGQSSHINTCFSSTQPIPTSGAADEIHRGSLPAMYKLPPTATEFDWKRKEGLGVTEARRSSAAGSFFGFPSTGSRDNQNIGSFFSFDCDLDTRLGPNPLHTQDAIPIEQVDLESSCPALSSSVPINGPNRHRSSLLHRSSPSPVASNFSQERSLSPSPFTGQWPLAGQGAPLSLPLSVPFPDSPLQVDRRRRSTQFVPDPSAGLSHSVIQSLSLTTAQELLSGQDTPYIHPSPSPVQDSFSDGRRSRTDSGSSIVSSNDTAFQLPPPTFELDLDGEPASPTLYVDLSRPLDDVAGALPRQLETGFAGALRAYESLVAGEDPLDERRRSVDVPTIQRKRQRSQQSLEEFRCEPSSAGLSHHPRRLAPASFTSLQSRLGVESESSMRRACQPKTRTNNPDSQQQQSHTQETSRPEERNHLQTKVSGTFPLREGELRERLFGMNFDVVLRHARYLADAHQKHGYQLGPGNELILPSTCPQATDPNASFSSLVSSSSMASALDPPTLTTSLQPPAPPSVSSVDPNSPASPITSSSRLTRQSSGSTDVGTEAPSTIFDSQQNAGSSRASSVFSAYSPPSPKEKQVQGDAAPVEIVIPESLFTTPPPPGLVLSLQSWSFDPLHFSLDDLLLSTSLIFRSLFLLDGLSASTHLPGASFTSLHNLIIALAHGYHHRNGYHNFAHAVDVLQACYDMLFKMGLVPSISLLAEEDYWLGNGEFQSGRKWKRSKNVRETTLSKLLGPGECFALLIAAIGHDVGHPGLSNAYMINARTPLAQVYEDKSVLENFHSVTLIHTLRKFGFSFLLDSNRSAATSQESYTAQDTKSFPNFRKILVESVLATDMSRHFGFVEKLKQKMAQPLGGIEETEEDLLFLCGSIIKCADLSNPTRPHSIARQWTSALFNEWNSQAKVERKFELDVTVVTFEEEAARNEAEFQRAQAKSQIGFLDIFVVPLFESMAGIVDEFEDFTDRLKEGRAAWTSISESSSRATPKILPAEEFCRTIRPPSPARVPSPDRCSQRERLVARPSSKSLANKASLLRSRSTSTSTMNTASSTPSRPSSTPPSRGSNDPGNQTDCTSQRCKPKLALPPVFSPYRTLLLASPHPIYRPLPLQHCCQQSPSRPSFNDDRSLYDPDFPHRCLEPECCLSDTALVQEDLRPPSPLISSKCTGNCHDYTAKCAACARKEKRPVEEEQYRAETGSNHSRC